MRPCTLSEASGTDGGVVVRTYEVRATQVRVSFFHLSRRCCFVEEHAGCARSAD